MKNDFENFSDWLPVRFYWQQERPLVDWCYFGRTRISESFFDQTLEKRFRDPFNLLFRHQTPVEFLSELNAELPFIAPTGFIFHLSRCGSTLVSQMLAALEQNIVLSEPPPLDSILRTSLQHPDVTDEQRIFWLRAMLGAFGRRRNPLETHLFVKFDCWNTLDLDLIRRAYPEVPWIFLYRNPVEIVVSQMRQRGIQAIPGMLGEILPELDLMTARRLPAEEYCARVLARICENVLAALPDRKALLVNYDQLPEAGISSIPKHFRVDFNFEEIEIMKNTARFNAKTPQLNFSSDSAEKKQAASTAALAAAEKWLHSLHEKLEKARVDFESTQHQTY